MQLSLCSLSNTRFDVSLGLPSLLGIPIKKSHSPTLCFLLLLFLTTLALLISAGYLFAFLICLQDNREGYRWLNLKLFFFYVEIPFLLLSHG